MHPEIKQKDILTAEKIRSSHLYDTSNQRLHDESKLCAVQKLQIKKM